jgi:hypothetical protein
VVAGDRTITGDLIAHFKLDESSGMTAANSGTDAINGEVFPDNVIVDWATGKIGNAFEDISGVGGILVPDYTKIEEEMTVSAWVRLTGIGDSDYQIIRNASGELYTAGSGTVSPPLGQFEFDLDFVSASVMNLRARVCAGVNVYSVRERTAFPLDEWQHVAFTADGRQIRLYRNGQLTGTTSYLDPINQPNVPWMSIGTRLATNTLGVIDSDAGTPPDGGPQVFYGQIDDVGIWRTAWPASVIQSIYEQGNAGQNLTAAVLPELPEVPTDITLSVGVGEDGSVSISWEPAGGTLEMSTDLGSWAPVGGSPTSPYTIASPAGNAFYRVNTGP